MKHNFKKVFHKSTVVLIFNLLSFLGFAQIYPVQVNPVFNTPYSSKISDYATSLDEKMRLLINPTDININNRQIRLKMFIQGNGINAQSTDFIEGASPIFINGGELLSLTNVDLAAYFQLQNLNGLSAVDYANPLPEGIYSICFEVHDYATNLLLSQKSCASIYLMLNDPPLLNIPVKNEQIAASNFPNILFTWTPRQINATNVSYQFELKELIDPTIDPQFGFEMAPVFYQEELFASAFLYDSGKPNLVQGRRYAWRVKAISTSGLSVNNIFKNNGYSEVFWFKYDADCTPPTYLLAETQSSSRVKLTWQGTAQHTKYHVQYKKKNVADAEWFSVYTVNTQALITDLEPSITYEFRVGASCEAIGSINQSYVYSGVNDFILPANATPNAGAYNCGINPTISITNQTPLPSLLPSETFTAGDFPVKVLEVFKSGNTFTGKGYVTVPYLSDIKISVVFDDITINTSYQLINGVVETTYDPSWGNVVDLDDFVEVDIFTNPTDTSNNGSTTTPINENTPTSGSNTNSTQNNNNTTGNSSNNSSGTTSTSNPTTNSPNNPTNPNQPPVNNNNPSNNTANEDDKFKSTKLVIFDDKFRVRIANEGETLYYVGKFKPTDIKLTLNTPKSKVNPKDITWFRNTSRLTELEGKLTFKLVEPTTELGVNNFTIKSLAGKPNKIEKIVNIKWVEESYISESVSIGTSTIPFLKKASELTKISEKINGLLEKIPFFKKAKKNEKLDADVGFYFDIIPFKKELINTEDENSRLYYSKKTTSGGLECGIEGSAKFIVWGLPYDKLPLPDRFIRIAKEYVTFDVYITAKANAGGDIKFKYIEKKMVEQNHWREDYKGFNPAFIKFDMEFGAGAEVKILKENPYFTLKGDASGIAKAQILNLGWNGENFGFHYLEEGINLDLTATCYAIVSGLKFEMIPFQKRIEIIKPNTL